MIHLSYHDGEHYSSVRSIDDKNLHNAPKEIHIVDKSKDRIEKEEKEKEKANNKGSPISEEELMIMEVTGCSNRAFVQQLLLDNWGDVNACIDFIYMVGAHDQQFQKEYLAEKTAELLSTNPNHGISSSSQKKSTPPPNSNHNNNGKPAKSNNEDFEDIEDEKGHSRKDQEENDDPQEGDAEDTGRREPRVDSHGRIKGKPNATNEFHGYGKKANAQQQQQSNEKDSDSLGDPAIHPKLKKFYEKQLTNKERQDRARQNKSNAHQAPLQPPTSSAPSRPPEVVDVTEVAKDLGSMMI
jgi:hypothetical protein